MQLLLVLSTVWCVFRCEMGARSSEGAFMFSDQRAFQYSPILCKVLKVLLSCVFNFVDSLIGFGKRLIGCQDVLHGMNDLKH